ncbi:dihydroorotase [Croceivirga thetidis]|uniref:Dihydroorotase n=1 Tax=Croceivirga thetidis TaxID=2721623 RepID=A0ABX1GT21_9FLAO|nr:dihydroorotase [Croceivirga thetidis]NKI32155.1 dihydroorotase [Croceivirga thetidis]
MNALLKSAIIVDSTNPKFHLKKRDILIRNGKIEKIANKIEVDNTVKTIALKNLHVSLGWFDSSVSFGEPGFEERETITNGLRTASKSGFTDIVLNTNTYPTPSNRSNIVYLKDRSKGEVCNLHPMGCLSVNSQGELMAELFDMSKAGAVAFSDYKHAIDNANLFKIALQYTQNFGGTVLSFPHDSQLTGKAVMNEGKTSTSLGLKGQPNLAEELRVNRDLFLLEYTGGSLHIPTISTAQSVKLISDAKKKGLNVSCSVAVHNLFLTDKKVEQFDANFKVNPPLRTEKDAKALVKGIQNGTIDFITSDHSPIDIEEKRLEFDNAEFGTIGMESTFGAINALLGFEEAITLLTKRTKWSNIETPEFQEGSKACLTLFNPEGEYQFSEANVYSTSKNSAFYGETLKGHVYGTINNGKSQLN